MAESILATGVYEQSYADGVRELSKSHDPSRLLTAAASMLINGAEQWELDRVRDASNRAISSISVSELQSGQDESIRDARILSAMDTENYFELEKGGLLIKHVGSYVVTHFPLRGKRPPGTAAKPINNVEQDYNAEESNFLSVIGETFYEDESGASTTNMIFNKFPFTRLHGLAVADIKAGLPQRLTKKAHEDTIRLLTGARQGFSIGFNGRGAYSSINHMHMQIMYDDPDEIVMPALAMAEYPIERHKFGHGPDGFEFIEEQYKQKTPITALYTPTGLLVFKRLFQGTETKLKRSSGYAIREITGVEPITDKRDYDEVTEGHQVEEALIGTTILREAA
jgi:hypothetical protein